MDKITTLLNEYGDAIYNFCLYTAKNKQDGEDLFQQTFLQAAKISSKIDKNNNPKSYLLSITINIWRNILQKQIRRNRIATMVDIGTSKYELIQDDGVDVESEAINKIESDMLLQIINRLNDKHRMPIILFYLEGMKISEISSLLHKPDGTIKRLLHEAKEKIKQEMESLGYER